MRRSYYYEKESSANVSKKVGIHNILKAEEVNYKSQGNNWQIKIMNQGSRSKINAFPVFNIFNYINFDQHL